MKRYYYLKTSQKHILVLSIHLVQTLCLQFQIENMSHENIGFVIAGHGWHKKSNKYFAPSWSFYII